MTVSLPFYLRVHALCERRGLRLDSLRRTDWARAVVTVETRPRRYTFLVVAAPTNSARPEDALFAAIEGAIR